MDATKPQYQGCIDHGNCNFLKRSATAWLKCVISSEKRGSDDVAGQDYYQVGNAAFYDMRA